MENKIKKYVIVRTYEITAPDEETAMTDNVWVTKEVIGNIYENPELLSTR